MAITIDELQVDINASASNASAGIDALTNTLTRLKTAVKGGAGLTTTTKQLAALSATIAAMSAPGTKIQEVVSALTPLSTLGKSNLGSTLKQLEKIPEITKALSATDMGAFATQIQAVTTAILPLSTEMEKVSLGFSKLPANIQKAINANAKLTESNHRASKSYGILGTGISAAVAKLTLAYIALRRVARVIAGWITESNAYVENLNLFTVAMGEYAESAQAYAEKVSEIMGIDPSQWMRNQGVFMTLATGFGVVSDKAALMSQNLTQLGYDLSSFFNIPIEDALQKLQSGISGELEPLRRLGYDLSVARLQEIALSLGIDKAVASMNQAEKSQLRYYAIMTQVTTAQGDMARTLKSPANQLRILSAQATQTARALGNIFIPALNMVLPYAIAFLRVIRTVAQEIANLFGFELPEVDYSGLNGLASSGDDAADSLEGAASAAKDLKNATIGLDELNVISPNTSSGGSGGSAGGSGDLSIDLPEYDFLGAIESQTDEIFNKIKKWVDDFNEKFSAVKGPIDRLTGAFKSLKDAVKDFSNNSDIQKVLKWLGNAVLTKGLDIFSGTILTLAGAFDMLSGLLSIVTSLINGDFDGALDGAQLMIQGLGEIIEGVFVIILGKEAVDKIKEFIKTWKENISAWWTEDVAPWFTKEKWTQLWSDVKRWWGDGWVSIKTWWKGSTLVYWWTDDVSPWFTATKWTQLWDKAKSGWTSGWASIRTWWDEGGISKWWSDSVSPWFTQEKWEDVMKGVGPAFESIFKNAVNGAISLFNDLIGWINEKMRFEWPSVPMLGITGGSIQLFTIPEIPELFANGGYPEQGELFVARESGAEMVGSVGRRTAVANNDQIVEGIASGVASANAEQNALLRQQNEYLKQLVAKDTSTYLDGRKVNNGLSKVSRERGVSIMAGGVLA